MNICVRNCQKPNFGFSGKHFNYLEASDIKYYNVPTPLTDLYFKTVMEQGQTLDAFLTINTKPNLNFSLAYKGLRSNGKYINNIKIESAELDFTHGQHRHQCLTSPQQPLSLR